MEVKPGYKHTEVGVIPEDWQVAPITSVLQRGSRITYGVVKPGPNRDDGVLFIRGGDVLDGKILTDQLRTIGKEISEQYKRTRLSGGELVISLVGYPGEVALVPPWLAGANIARQVALVRLDSSQPLSGDYICRFLQSNTGRRLLLKESIGSAQQVINLRDITRVVLVLPTEPEQRAIAEALTDVDGLLGGLDQLIAKKRDLKQAAMEQLLTGQIRLPGCHGEWDLVRLGDLFSFKNGLNKAKKFFGHGTPIVNYMDVFGSPMIRASRLEGRVSLSRIELRNFDVQKGDVFFTRTSETTEEIGIASVMVDEPTDTVFSGFLLRARPLNKRLHDAFKAHSLGSASVRKQIISKASYTTRALTNGRILSEILLPLPSLPEQAAIAEVLSEMDAELAALEQRREKTRSLKQGMMQELLTGKTRLL